MPTDNPEPDTLRDAILANRVEAFATFGRTPGASLVAGPELTLIFTGYPQASPLCSWVMQARLAPGQAGRAIESTVHFFRRQQLPFIWMLDPRSTPADLDRRLAGHGLHHLFDLTGMALPLHELPGSSGAPASLQVREVETEQDFRAWVRVFREAFAFATGPEEPVMRLIHHAWQASAGRWRHYLGLLNGEPVATASLYLAAGVAGIYFVGTLPAVRRRGIGTFITAVPLQVALKLGYQTGILHAAAGAAGIYERLGFQPYATLPLYAWQQENQGRL